MASQMLRDSYMVGTIPMCGARGSVTSEAATRPATNVVGSGCRIKSGSRFARWVGSRAVGLLYGIGYAVGGSTLSPAGGTP